MILIDIQKDLEAKLITLIFLTKFLIKTRDFVSIASQTHSLTCITLTILKRKTKNFYFFTTNYCDHIWTNFTTKCTKILYLWDHSLPTQEEQEHCK